MSGEVRCSDGKCNIVRGGAVRCRATRIVGPTEKPGGSGWTTRNEFRFLAMDQ